VTEGLAVKRLKPAQAPVGRVGEKARYLSGFHPASALDLALSCLLRFSLIFGDSRPAKLIEHILSENLKNVS
jgi:hypothetical protein